MVIIVMGVAAAGKTTVGRRLAEDLDWAFHDADDYHPDENVAKMAAGNPLTDADRRPWLARLAQLISASNQQGESIVLACSALRRRYRRRLTRGTGPTAIVYLQADRALIRKRLNQRDDHFMASELLESQFETLEEPEHALTIPAELPVNEAVGQIRSTLNL